MKCPKCSKEELADSVLADGLAVKTCEACKGSWIASEDYETWQTKQPQQKVTPEELGEKLNIEFGQSPLDTRAALCPECGRYLSRAKVKLKTPFFVDRCQQCGGIWCDYGEWDILTQLGLHTSIEQLFERKWQTEIEQQKLLNSERQAMIEKMGETVAKQVFEIAEVLSQHPNGDFALAYLMRKVVPVQESQKR